MLRSEEMVAYRARSALGWALPLEIPRVKRGVDKLAEKALKPVGALGRLLGRL